MEGNQGKFTFIGYLQEIYLYREFSFIRGQGAENVRDTTSETQQEIKVTDAQQAR